MASATANWPLRTPRGWPPAIGLLLKYGHKATDPFEGYVRKSALARYPPPGVSATRRIHNLLDWRLVPASPELAQGGGIPTFFHCAERAPQVDAREIRLGSRSLHG